MTSRIRSRCSNLRIINISKGSKKDQDPTKFVKDLLKMVTGPDVFSSLLEIELPWGSAWGNWGPLSLNSSISMRKKKVLRWASQHKMDYRSSKLRVYPDISTALAKKRAAYNAIKNSLYLKGIKFHPLHPACLQVSFWNENFYFDSPQKAHFCRAHCFHRQVKASYWGHLLYLDLVHIKGYGHLLALMLNMM